jgi:hypothetical protein
MLTGAPAGNTNLVVTSTDGGATWTQVYSSTMSTLGQALNKLSYVSGNVWIATPNSGVGANILRTTITVRLGQELHYQLAQEASTHTDKH